MNFLIILFYCIVQFIFIIFGSAHRTVEEAKAEQQQFIEKHIKTLKKENGAIKLVGGRDEYEGNVEILYNGKWGSICDDEWDKNEAEVVCRQLKFPGYKKVTYSAAFGLARRNFWMDNIFCNGTEKELGDCRFNGWGENDCDSSEAAGVVCKSLKKIPKIQTNFLRKPKNKIHSRYRMQIRLAGGRTESEGRVEVKFHKSKWGTICADGWSILEANVICRQLGLGYAMDALQTDIFGGSNNSKIILSGTKCYGNETILAKCHHYDPKKYIICHGDKNHVAAVICTKSLPDLIFDFNELEESAHLEDKQMFYLQCAMEENCIASEAYEIQKNNPAWHLEVRRLLKFTASVMNIGTKDFRPSIPKHLWEWHMCHMHFHSMEIFATFDIYDNNNKKVAEGHKASFCLEDNQCLPGVTPKYACANYGDQGISVNCSDIYRYNIDCQWVDITDMDYGDYTMKVAINPEFKVPEISYENNAAICKLIYSQTYAKVYNCKLQRP